ncbi:MAG: peptide chain release factor 1 [Christensenellales bacterium]
MLDRFKDMEARFEELNAWLSQPDAMSDAGRWRERMREHADLSVKVEAYRAYNAAQKELEELEEAGRSGDAELEELAGEELPAAREAQKRRLEALRLMLVPEDPNDRKNVILEIRAGTGGEEAALFAGELLRMYQYYAQQKGWSMEITDGNETELGGIKTCTCLISGTDVYSHLKFESGAHRVQRVPATESGGRIHTSAATVAVLPEAEEVEVSINPGDLRVDTYRSTGAGGQHINKTESAIRLTHLPTGLVVECQEERSQIKNREKAMRVLRSRLYDYFQSQADAEYAANRRTQVGSGDRSEKIRTYNYPQERVTDHRIGLTLYKLESFMAGDMDEMIEALRLDERARKLEEEGF